MMSRPVTRTLDHLEAQFREISERASALVSGQDPAIVALRPKPESWSAAECFAHLNLSVDPYFPVWERELDPARPNNRTEKNTYRLDFWGVMLVWMLEPPPKFRFPAPRKSQPVSIGEPDKILPGFLDRQGRIMEAIQQARGIAIDKIKIVSPFDARVHYSIWSSFCVNASHERRHLWQAERAVQSLASASALNRAS
jgi:hypothetical protein